MSISSGEMLNRFAGELTDWSRTGKIPECANQDVRYALELQKERIDRQGVQMVYELKTPANETEHSISTASESGLKLHSELYEVQLVHRNFIRKTRFLLNGATKFRDKRQDSLYTAIVDKKGMTINPEEANCCPNCGAVTTIGHCRRDAAIVEHIFTSQSCFPRLLISGMCRIISDKAV